MDTTDRIAKRVLLIGWDAADWQIASPLMASGRMPHLSALVERGVSGNLATLHPILSPMLWSSVATGHTADKHGILGFVEPLPDRSGVRPVSSRSRRCKAMWNLLTQSGMKSNVVGWYASHPAEPIEGVMVSNLFEQPKGPITQDWEVPDRAVHPPDKLDELKSLRVHPGEIDASVVAPFIPRLQEAAEKFPKKIAHLRGLMAQTASIHAVTTHLIEHTDWDLTAAYYEGIDRFGHEFMHLHPPKMEQVEQEEFELFQHVITGCYLFHDMMLGRLVELAGDDTAIVLVSDHGYFNDHLRPDPREGKAGPTDWHRPLGVVAMAGPGIKQGESLYGANLLDITPTVLRLLGLPVGSDMRGRPWVEALEATLDAKRIVSWEAVDGDGGTLGPDDDEDPQAAQAMMQQLIDLGYVDPPGEDAEKSVREAELEGVINLATSLRHTRRPQLALEALEAVDEQYRDTSMLRMQRALCWMALGEADRCRDELKSLIEADADSARVQMLLGVLALNDADAPAAVAHFTRAVEAQPSSPDLHLKLAQAHLGAADLDAARPLFERVLELDPDHAAAHHGLSEIARRQGRTGDAIDHALDAVARQHFLPRAHLSLGKALVDAGDLDHAADALRVAIGQVGHYREAHELLADIYARQSKPAEAAEQRRLAGEAGVALASRRQTAPASP
ncbi:MAG: alkaline phosphatase family protein [Planctomycetota bacterium]